MNKRTEMRKPAGKVFEALIVLAPFDGFRPFQAPRATTAASDVKTKNGMDKNKKPER